jgi:hypothetical protein
MRSNTVRFWIVGPRGNDVRLTLRAGDTLAHSHGGATEEGWNRESSIWHFDGRCVVAEWRCDGMDCDGRLTSGGRSYFVVEDAQAGYCDPETGLRFPAWQERRRSGWQRDYSAEAAGY